MPSCEYLAGCPFFNERLAHMPRPAALYKALYCRGNQEICARHIIAKALGREAVPADLFPNQESAAREILENHRKSSSGHGSA